MSIDGNTSGGNGGGVDNEGGAHSSPMRPLNRNSAVFGGGVYNDGGSTFSSSDTSVNHNTTTGDGAGIYNNGGSVNLSSSVSINSNTADADGGGIYSTVVLSVPSGDVKYNIPDNLVPWTSRTRQKGGPPPGGPPSDCSSGFAGGGRNGDQPLCHVPARPEGAVAGDVAIGREPWRAVAPRSDPAEMGEKPWGQRRTRIRVARPVA